MGSSRTLVRCAASYISSGDGHTQIRALSCFKISYQIFLYFVMCCVPLTWIVNIKYNKTWNSKNRKDIESFLVSSMQLAYQYATDLDNTTQDIMWKAF